MYHFKYFNQKLSHICDAVKKFSYSRLDASVPLILTQCVTQVDSFGLYILYILLIKLECGTGRILAQKSGQYGASTVRSKLKKTRYQYCPSMVPSKLS